MTDEEAIKGLQNIVEYWTIHPHEQECAETAISALRERIDRQKSKTNADYIHAMSDEELARWITDISECYQEKIACTGKSRKTSEKCNGKCKKNRLDWLRQPYKEKEV